MVESEEWTRDDCLGGGLKLESARDDIWDFVTIEWG